MTARLNEDERNIVAAYPIVPMRTWDRGKNPIYPE